MTKNKTKKEKKKKKKTGQNQVQNEKEDKTKKMKISEQNVRTCIRIFHLYAIAFIYSFLIHLYS